MNAWRIIGASLAHHRRMNAALACGVAVGTAVLTGALLVGDSMRGSLRHLTLDRLGRIEAALTPGRYFRAQAAEELAAAPGFARYFRAALPVILLNTSVESEVKTEGGSAQRSAGRANQVQLIGCTPAFWRQGEHGPVPPSGPSDPPGPREIVINRPLADLLQVRPGDTLLVRLPKPGAIPADTALGRKGNNTETQRFTLKAILPAAGLGAFSLLPNQRSPRNAFVALDWLQDRLGQTGRINALLVAGVRADDFAPDGGRALDEMWRPRLADLGVSLRTGPQGYLEFTSRTMIIEPPVEQAIQKALPAQEWQPVLTYLANAIACRGHSIPYSTVTAIDWRERPPLGPLPGLDGKPIPAGPDGSVIGDDEIVLNQWAADDLGARPGDRVRLDYFEPESVHGAVREAHVELRLKAVCPLAGVAADSGFTPDVPGVTDQKSMTDWEAPFPFDARRVRPKDDLYWVRYRGTPKGFVSLATGRRLWASRFGQTTALRVAPPPGLTARELEEKIVLPAAALGFAFQPVKQQGLAAAAGTTPFNLLFLGFSMFVIASALMLVALLFRLNVEGRAREIGLMLAVGIPHGRVRGWLFAEALVDTLLGSLAGVLLGIGYAALMLTGLRTWWLSAIVTPFLRLYMTPESLGIGYASGTLVALAIIAWSLWRLRRLSVRRLLAGETGDLRSPAVARLGDRPQQGGGRPQLFRWIEVAALLLLAALSVGLLGVKMDDEARAGTFFGTGFLALTVLLVLAWIHLRRGTTGPAVAPGGGNLARLALRSAGRNPGRSTLTMGLVASAAFLIIAVSAFRLDPTIQKPDLHSSNGGLALVAQCDQPLYHDLNTPAGREQLDFSTADQRLLGPTTTFALRVKPGDDASCLNLFQPRQPRVLGLPGAMLQRGGFAWAGTAAGNAVETANPWLLLNRQLSPDANGVARVPVVLDAATSEFSLHLPHGVGDTYEIHDGQGRPLRLQVVGLLANSLFQGDLLIAEDAFLRAFPEVSGYRFFLIAAPPDAASDVARTLERVLGDYGLVTETTGGRLARFLAVQNTYLSTFQSLGSLGLLLGSLGLAVVLLRNVLERRGELALLRAVGFRRRRLAELVLMENMALLLAGLATGALAAVVAVLPQLVFRTAAIPWLELAGSLTVVVLAGLAAGAAAVGAALRAPLIPALRSE